MEEGTVMWGRAMAGNISLRIAIWISMTYYDSYKHSTFKPRVYEKGDKEHHESSCETSSSIP